jgi:hypothetical protein
MQDGVVAAAAFKEYVRRSRSNFAPVAREMDFRMQTRTGSSETQVVEHLRLFSCSRSRVVTTSLQPDHGRKKDHETPSNFLADMSGPPGNGSYPTSSGMQHNGHPYATGQPVHPGSYTMNEQHSYATPSSSTFGQGVSNTASDPSVREVLGVYPFMQYTPSARGTSRREPLDQAHLYSLAVAKHLSSLTITHPAIPTLEQLHPQYEKDFARLSNPTSEADYAFWNANMREAERLMATYGTGIGGGATRGSGFAGSVAADLSSGR